MAIKLASGKFKHNCALAILVSLLFKFIAGKLNAQIIYILQTNITSLEYFTLQMVNLLPACNFLTKSELVINLTFGKAVHVAHHAECL